MAIMLYDSYSRTLKKVGKNVKLYVCGITPYDHAHIGHARTYVLFDVLKRFLIFSGMNVFHIQNVTDVDDKILKKAKETGQEPIKMAHAFNDEAMELFDKLNILRADVYPKATEHIGDMIKIIKALVEKGIAYETKTGVYFSVSKFNNYGKLSSQSMEEIKKHRIEPDETKKHEADFALWKKTDERPCWHSEFGNGRPGWHIECSAMALKYAKGTLTIHGGGRDLIFPHHENEIAQSEALTGKQFAKIWVHTGPLTINGQKMSKSLGNYITIKDALSKYSPNVMRLFFITSSINSPIDFDEKNMKLAEANMRNIEEAYKSIETIINAIKQDETTMKKYKEVARIRKEIINIRREFIKSLEDNLNTPTALSHFYAFLKLINANINYIDRTTAEICMLFFREFSFITGIKFDKLYNKEREKKLVDMIINLRSVLRQKGFYELSDEIRKKLKDIDIEIYDEGNETKIRYL